MICPNCGNVSDGNSFCSQCGVELASPLDLAADAADVSNLPVEVLQPSGALTGKTLDQRYYLESKLGVGGMGTVYRASRLQIGDWVAVKVLHQDQMADPRAIERFRREAQIAARLKHPNVVAVHDFGVSEEGLSYLVMDLAEGESLSSMIERQGALAESAAAEIARQVCAALDEAHRQGVVHRDIKPQNIVVQTIQKGLQVKVLDFGSAASIDITTRLTRNGAVIGTPHYMSPEYCLGEELDGRSDIYSLGIVLFEMLTGVVPFDSPTPTAIVIKHVNDTPPPPRMLNPKISPAIESVALRALEKGRDARQQTATEMARELISSVNAEPVSPEPAMVATPEIVTPESVTTSGEVDLPESNSNVATLGDNASALGEAFAKMGSSGKFVFLLFCALLLLAGGGLWRYLPEGGNENAAAKTDSAGTGQQISTDSGQPTRPQRGAAGSPATSPSAGSLPSSDKPWELVPDQTRGVANAANALGVADRRMAAIDPGGQLALEYRGGMVFSNKRGSDVLIHGPQQGRVSYLIFVRNDPNEGWKRIGINRIGFPRRQIGHDMSDRGLRQRLQQARQVMIRNIGNADLKIDAVSVVYKN